MSDSNRTVGMEKGQDHVLGYMCGTDWEFELGMASGGNVVYPTPEEAKCSEECGAVEVKVSFSRWAKEPVDE